MDPIAGPDVAIVIVTSCGVLVKSTGEGIEPQLMPRVEAGETVPVESVTVVHSNTTSKLPAPAGVASEIGNSDVWPGKTPVTCCGCTKLTGENVVAVMPEVSVAVALIT